MIKLAILGVVAVILAIQLEDKKEYGIYIGIICLILITLFVLD